MIVNGSSNRCVWWWTKHLESDANDKVRVVGSYGLQPGSIHEMLEQMMDLTRGTNVSNGFYQINMNPAPGENLTEQDWDKAREIAEKKHGLEGQPYFVVMHTKHGREHPHFIYSRVDLETGKAISDSHDARKNHAIAREIERDLGLEKVIGPYDHEPDEPRPERAPKRWEMYRGMQTGIDPRDITAEVTELYHQSESGQAFQTALEQHGYELVAGRRGLLILDSAGKEHSLARRIEGINTKELNAFMRHVDREGLPTLEQAQERFQERKMAGLHADRETVRHEIEWEEGLAKAAIEKEKVERRFVGIESDQKQATWAVGRGQREHDHGGTERIDNARSGIDIDECSIVNGVGKAAEQMIGGAFDIAAGAFESLFGGPSTPEQARDAEIAADRQQAEAEQQAEFSRHMADLEQQRHQYEQGSEVTRRERDVDRDR